MLSEEGLGIEATYAENNLIQPFFLLWPFTIIFFKPVVLVVLIQVMIFLDKLSV